MERPITIYKSPGEGIGISMDTTPDRGHVSKEIPLATVTVGHRLYK